MRVNVKTLIWYLSTYWDLKEPILDIGAKQSPNQLLLADLRPMFRNKQYIGCDYDKGLGVDIVADAENLQCADFCMGTVLCLDTIEHARDPVKIMKEIARVATKEGIVVVTSHMYAPVHYDLDYWRFTPQCFHDILLGDYCEKKILLCGEKNFPELVAGIASRAFLPALDIGELNSMLPWNYPFGFYEWEKVQK